MSVTPRRELKVIKVSDIILVNTALFLSTVGSLVNLRAYKPYTLAELTAMGPVSTP